MHEKRHGGKSFKDFQNEKEVQFDPNGRWREVVVPRFTANPDAEDKSNSYFMIPLVDNAFRDRLTAIASGLSIKYWVFGCVAMSWNNSTRFWYFPLVTDYLKSFLTKNLCCP